MEEVLEMSKKELDRYHIIQQLKCRKLTHSKAAALLNLSERQVRNLLVQFNTYGTKGLISKKRGHPSNRQTPIEVKREVLRLICENYEDFGPHY